MTGNVLELNDETFNTETSSGVTIIDFWAEWCGPCKMMAPVFQKVAEEYAGKVKFAKMDVDQNQDVPTKFMVRSIPTFIIMKDGQKIATKIGGMSEADLKSFVNSNI